MNKKNITFGDIFEIHTPVGRAYMQYVKWNEELGYFVRVLRPVVAARPGTFADIVAQPERFLTFFPLRAAQSKAIVEWVGNEPVPRRFDTWPILRSPGRIDSQTREVRTWWLWDGTRSVQVDRLTTEQMAFSLKEIINDTALINRIVQDWKPSQFASNSKEPPRST